MYILLNQNVATNNVEFADILLAISQLCSVCHQLNSIIIILVFLNFIG